MVGIRGGRIFHHYTVPVDVSNLLCSTLQVIILRYAKSDLKLTSHLSGRFTIDIPSDLHVEIYGLAEQPIVHPVPELVNNPKFDSASCIVHV
ncbi:MAG: hypothetical protein JJE09_10865 [Bacteroidia bacterium]|nr:hypothetical protein [Bacteroidia bacterium]